MSDIEKVPSPVERFRSEVIEVRSAIFDAVWSISNPGVTDRSTVVRALSYADLLGAIADFVIDRGNQSSNPQLTRVAGRLSVTPPESRNALVEVAIWGDDVVEGLAVGVGKNARGPAFEVWASTGESGGLCELVFYPSEAVAGSDVR